MIDIYDELGYIKNVLSDGLSQKWERDAMLLTRYYKMENLKKADAKAKILQKCEEAATRNENPIGYNHLISYKRFNKIFETAWKKQVPLRTIREVKIAKEVVEWFLNLESTTSLSQEEIEYYKIRRPKIVIKKNNPMNWNRVKYLFTLYVWTKVQENYLDRPDIHYLKNVYKRFKEDADLPASFSMKEERNFLYDLGYIDINYALGIEPAFMKNNEVFNTPLTPENTLTIYTGEVFEGDLYHPGYWLEKQKKGSFVCESCGKEFANYTKYTGGRPRKYCKECGDKINHHNTAPSAKTTEEVEIKTIYCSECGKRIKISKYDNKTTKCTKCQLSFIREYDRERKKQKNSV